MKAVVDLNVRLSWFSGRVTGTIEIKSPTMPGVIKLAEKSQEDSMLLFDLVLPAPGAKDVVSRELEIKIGEGEPVVSSLAADATLATGFQGEDNAVVLAKLTDIDDAGNRSPAREQSWTLTDTIAPPEPGEMGLNVTAEQ